MEIIMNTNTNNTGIARNRKIKYIVIHYTAGTHSDKGSARTVANFFATNARASADFIVDDAEIVQYNPDIHNRYTFAVGGLVNKKVAPYYKKCTNVNSISIEMCSNNSTKQVTSAGDRNWYFTQATINNTIKLVKKLQAEYGLDDSRVITHNNVNGKVCPGVYGWTQPDTEWQGFKQLLAQEQEDDEEMTQEQFNKMMDNYIAEKAKETTTWGTDDLNWAKGLNLMVGDYQGNMMPNKFFTRLEIAAILRRFYNILKK